MASPLPPLYRRLRFATSLAATALMNLGALGLTFRSVCTPGFYCHGCPWATFACPIGVIAYGAALHTFPLLALGLILASAALLGRMLCSFACPVGLLQDLLHRIPSPKFKLPKAARYGKYATLLLLVLVFPFFLGFNSGGFLKVQKPVVNKADAGQLSVKVDVTNLGTEPVPHPQLTVLYRALDGNAEILREARDFPDVTVPPGATVTLPTFEIPNRLATASLVVDSPQSSVDASSPWNLYYCRLCPTGTLTATIPSYWASTRAAPFAAWLARNALRLTILLVFLALMAFVSRPVCRLFCPLGAIYALTARASLAGMKLDPARCTSCTRCDKVCPVHLDVRKELSGPECIACGDCAKACPQHGIKRTYGL